jgi:hypothetical protein
MVTCFSDEAVAQAGLERVVADDADRREPGDGGHGAVVGGGEQQVGATSSSRMRALSPTRPRAQMRRPAIKEPTVSMLNCFASASSPKKLRMSAGWTTR